MARKFTSGKFAFAICDRCGDKIKYKDLKTEYTGFRVCKICLDPKTKQEYPTRAGTVNDPESLKNPRPDADVEAGKGVISSADYTNGETPIGQQIEDEGKITVELGQVTVSIT